MFWSACDAQSHKTLLQVFSLSSISLFCITLILTVNTCTWTHTPWSSSWHAARYALYYKARLHSSQIRFEFQQNTAVSKVLVPSAGGNKKSFFVQFCIKSIATWKHMNSVFVSVCAIFETLCPPQRSPTCWSLVSLWVFFRWVWLNNNNR